MLAMSMRVLRFKFWDFYQVFPGEREVTVSERIRTRETLAYRQPPVHCSTDHLQFTAVRIDTLNALLHGSSEVKHRAVLLKLLLLTLGEYKFGINWFSAKMWSVKPRKIKTPGGELCNLRYCAQYSYSLNKQLHIITTLICWWVFCAIYHQVVHSCELKFGDSFYDKQFLMTKLS